MDDPWVRERLPALLARWPRGGVGLLVALGTFLLPLLGLGRLLFPEAGSLGDGLLLLAGAGLSEHLAAAHAAAQAARRGTSAWLNAYDLLSLSLATAALAVGSLAAARTTLDAAWAAWGLTALAGALLAEVGLRLLARRRLPPSLRVQPPLARQEAQLARVFEEGQPGSAAALRADDPDAHERLHQLAVPGPCLSLPLAACALALGVGEGGGSLGVGLAAALVAAGCARQAAEQRRSRQALGLAPSRRSAYRLTALALLPPIVLLGAAEAYVGGRLVLWGAAAFAGAALFRTRPAAF